MRGKKIEGLTPRETALSDFFREWECHPEKEYIPLAEAAGRVTAEELYSMNTLPVHRVSGGDGIAVRSADFADGMPDYKAWTEGREFARADTGDDFADEYDAVIMIEEVDLDEKGNIKYISPDLTVKAGDHVMAEGSTARKGDLIIKANMPLRPTDLAALAMGGISMVPVIKKPRVSFIPTGSELVTYDRHPVRGQNVDSNSLLVKTTLEEMGAEPVIFPIVPDSPDDLRTRLKEALSMSDFVIMNAGTAKGSEDFNFGLLGEAVLRSSVFGTSGWRIIRP